MFGHKNNLLYYKAGYYIDFLLLDTASLLISSISTPRSVLIPISISQHAFPTKMLEPTLWTCDGSSATQRLLLSFFGSCRFFWFFAYVFLIALHSYFPLIVFPSTIVLPTYSLPPTCGNITTKMPVFPNVQPHHIFPKTMFWKIWDSIHKSRYKFVTTTSLSEASCKSPP